MQHTLFKGSALICAATLSSLTHAHDGSDHDMPVYVLDEIVLSAGPIARPVDDFTSPFTSIDSASIQRKSSGTLGELLDGELGVSATSFGGGASRPVVRGFDGPRLHIVESGLGSGDVSSTSPDHATTVEPLLTERVEILRGPSTLLYGSSAIGGVVNVIGREIAREPLEDKNYEGTVEARYDTVSKGETYIATGTVGADNWALRLNALSRKADDYKIPGEAEADHDEEEHHDEHDEDEHHDDEEHHEEESSDRLESSFVENDSISIGNTWFFGNQNYFGVSFSSYDAYYGVPGHEHAHHEEEEGEHHDDEEEEEHHEEEGVVVDLERKRLDLELALFELTDWIEAARFRFAYTDYEHNEIEEEEAAATFLREGWELRAEAAHGAWALFDEGVFGVDLSETDFEATGEELESDTGTFAFGPPSNTLKQAAFISEHIHNDDWHYEFGGRLEAQQIDVDGAKDYSDLALSIAAGIIYEIDENNSLALSLQRSQRHATTTELYAEGPHLATQVFEIGDPNLGLETAYGIDLTYRHQSDEWSSSISVFYTYFDDYIYAEETGEEEDELEVLEYGQVDAIFWGFEAEIERVLAQSADLQITASLLADYVNAQNEDENDELPRIPPLRVGGKLRFVHGNWNGGALLRYAFEQNNTAHHETETDAYTEFNIDAGYTFQLSSKVDCTLFTRVSNLLDEEIRQHTSYIKDEAPLPGRNFTIGARLNF